MCNSFHNINLPKTRRLPNVGLMLGQKVIQGLLSVTWCQNTANSPAPPPPSAAACFYAEPSYYVFHMYVNPCASRTVYIYVNPCAARPVYIH